MNIFKMALLVWGAGLVLAPAAASAAVQFDDVTVESATETGVNGAIKSDTPSQTYNSLGVLERGVLKTANNLAVKATGSAQADSTSAAKFTSAASGSYGFVQDAASSISRSAATAYGVGSGSVDYVFTITGPSSYDILIDGQEGGSASGSSSTGTFDTSLWDATTGTYLFLNDIAAGQSFSDLVTGLTAGVYDLASESGAPVFSASAGCTCSSGLAADAAGFDFSISAVPEPAEWALMVLGIALIGGALRASRRANGATYRLQA